MHTNFANLFHEVQMLAHLPRSGLPFLGSGRQSVGEHSYGTAVIAFALARLINQPLDELKLLKLCLFHDLLESRTGDHNYVQKRYLSIDQKRLEEDFSQSSALAPEILALIREYDAKETLEATLARDANFLELLVFLKREIDIGNKQASDWFTIVEERLRHAEAKTLAQEIATTPFDNWWRTALKINSV